MEYPENPDYIKKVYSEKLIDLKNKAQSKQMLSSIKLNEIVDFYNENNNFNDDSIEITKSKTNHHLFNAFNDTNKSWKPQKIHFSIKQYSTKNNHPREKIKEELYSINKEKESDANVSSMHLRKLFSTKLLLNNFIPVADNSNSNVLEKSINKNSKYSSYAIPLANKLNQKDLLNEGKLGLLDKARMKKLKAKEFAYNQKAVSMFKTKNGRDESAFYINFSPFHKERERKDKFKKKKIVQINNSNAINNGENNSNENNFSSNLSNDILEADSSQNSRNSIQNNLKLTRLTHNTTIKSIIPYNRNIDNDNNVACNNNDNDVNIPYQPPLAFLINNNISNINQLDNILSRSNSTAFQKLMIKNTFIKNKLKRKRDYCNRSMILENELIKENQKFIINKNNNSCNTHLSKKFAIKLSNKISPKANLNRYESKTELTRNRDVSEGNIYSNNNYSNSVTSNSYFGKIKNYKSSNYNNRSGNKLIKSTEFTSYFPYSPNNKENKYNATAFLNEYYSPVRLGDSKDISDNNTNNIKKLAYIGKSKSNFFDRNSIVYNNYNSCVSPNNIDKYNHNYLINKTSSDFSNLNINKNNNNNSNGNNETVDNMLIRGSNTIAVPKENLNECVKNISSMLYNERVSKIEMKNSMQDLVITNDIYNCNNNNNNSSTNIHTNNKTNTNKNTLFNSVFSSNKQFSKKINKFNLFNKDIIYNSAKSLNKRVKKFSNNKSDSNYILKNRNLISSSNYNNNEDVLNIKESSNFNLNFLCSNNSQSNMKINNNQSNYLNYLNNNNNNKINDSKSNYQANNRSSVSTNTNINYNNANNFNINNKEDRSIISYIHNNINFNDISTNNNLDNTTLNNNQDNSIIIIQSNISLLNNNSNNKSNTNKSSSNIFNTDTKEKNSNPNINNNAKMNSTSINYNKGSISIPNLKTNNRKVKLNFVSDNKKKF